MKSVELSTKLNDLIEESGYRSILIDGPWGCGKTFEIQKYMNQTKRECIYVSLFGLESIDEINTEIFKASYPNKVKAGKVLTIISKAFAPVKYVGSISDALSFQLNNVDKTKIKKSLIIIFDDLERLSGKIDYKDLVGYINKLFFFKARVICLCSSKNIEPSRLASFNQFKEKVFDCCFSVKETDYIVYNEIFKDLGVNDLDLIYPLFENNIRTAKRTYLFYKDLIEHFDFENHKYFLTKYDLLRSCVYTVLCVFNSKAKPEIKGEYKSAVYEQLIDDYGESVANSVYHYLRYDKDDSIGNIHNTVLSLIDCYINRDFDAFEKQMRYVEVHNKEIDILDKCPFYLSEENKRLYFDNLNVYVDNMMIYTDITTRRVRDLYYYTEYTLSEERIKKLAEVYLMTVKKEYISKSSIGDFIFPAVNKKTGSIAVFVSTFSDAYLKAYTQEITECFYEAVDDAEFSKASDLISQLVNFGVDDVIKQMLINNNFFLKDLDKDISDAQWSFMNSIAKIANKQSLSKEYVAAVEQYRNSFKEVNNTLKIRLTTLVNVNIS